MNAGERQCTKCRAFYPLSGFSPKAYQCRACRSAIGCAVYAAKVRAKAQKDGPRSWIIPADPRSPDQQLLAIRQQEWIYPVDPTNNLRWTP